MINLSFNKKTYLVFAFVLVFCTKVYSAPHINSIEGSISNGGKITITGTDFGANGPSIAIFDDFENGRDEQNIPVGSSSVATLGRWDGYKKGGSQIFFSNDYAWSGKLAYQGRSGPGYSGDGIAIITEFSPTKEIFGIWWVYFPTECEWPWDPQLSYGWKQVWFHSEFDHTGSDFIINTIPWPNGGSLVAGNFAGGWYKSGFTMPKGQWVRMRVSWTGGASSNGRVKIHYLKYNGSNTEVKWIDETNLTNMSNGSDSYKLVELGAWTRIHPTTVAKLIFDDFYVATGPNSQARVEIGDKSSYSSCTNLAVLTPDAWQNDQIQATVRLGSFQPETTAYVFVIDAQGTISGGRAVTIGGTVSVGDEPAIVPTGLRF